MLGPTLKVAGALVVGAAGFLAHRTGLFHGVRWRSGVKTDSFSFVFLAHQGPYASIGSKFDEVVKLLANAAKPVKVCCATHRSVGVYYDDPKATPAKELRSCAGIILEGDELTAAVNAGLPMKTVPAHENAIAADFPLQNARSITSPSVPLCRTPLMTHSSTAAAEVGAVGSSQSLPEPPSPDILTPSPLAP